MWETSGAALGKTVFMSGNHDADFSIDGQHFTQVNPSAMNTSFCCDQIVQYAPQIRRFIWLVQGNPGSTGHNVDVLAVSSPATLRASGGRKWTSSWTFQASQISKPNDWYDYPDLAIGKRDLIWTTNVIGSGDSVIQRIPLAALAAGKGLTVQYALFPGQIRPAQQTGGTTYWASLSDTSTVTSYSSPESTLAINATPIPIPTQATSNWSIKLPNGSEWLDPVTAHTKLNPSMQSGTLAGGKLYFAWSAGRDVNGKQTWQQPHIEIAVIDAATATLDRMLYIWNAHHAWAWPALTSNAAGEVGMVANFGGGGGMYAYPYAGIIDATGAKQFKRISQGKNGISSAGGHYITVRPFYPGGNCFAAFVFDEYPIGTTNNPVYAVFGHPNLPCNGG